jgi:hypothetical protein
MRQWTGGGPGARTRLNSGWAQRGHLMQQGILDTRRAPIVLVPVTAPGAAMTYVEQRSEPFACVCPECKGALHDDSAEAFQGNHCC